MPSMAIGKVDLSSAAVGSHADHVLKAWLEKEVASRLRVIDEKFDSLVSIILAARGTSPPGSTEASAEEQQELSSSWVARFTGTSAVDEHSVRYKMVPTSPSFCGAASDPGFCLAGNESGDPPQEAIVEYDDTEDDEPRVVLAGAGASEQGDGALTARSSMGHTLQVDCVDGLVEDLRFDKTEALVPRQLSPRGRSSIVGSKPLSTRSRDSATMRIIAELDNPRRGSIAMDKRKSDRSWNGGFSETASSNTTRYRSDIFGYFGLVGDECTIHPHAPWYCLWTHFITITVIFSAFFAPLRYGFVPDDPFVLRLDSAIDCIFAVDLLLTCNVALVMPEGLITDRKRIFWAYFSSSRFWIDILATIPFDMLWVLIMGEQYGGQDDQIYGLIGLLRLLRVNRILEQVRELQKSTKLNLLSVVVLKFVLFILLITHTAGCVMYGLARANDFQQGTWVYEADPGLPNDALAAQYMHALYWAVSTYKAGPAHGSLYPRNSVEMLVACLAMLLNICLQTYLVSSMAALLTTTDMSIYAHRVRLRQLGEFAERHALSPELQKQLQAYLWFKFNTDQDLDQEVLAGFPELYQSRINHVLYADLISSMKIFQGCAPAFLRQLYGALKPTLHMAEHVLVNAGEPSTQLQIIATGEVEMYYQGAFVEIRYPGETITEVPFICNVDQQFMVRTRMLCRTLSVDRSHWDDICEAHALDVGLVKSNLYTFCKQRAALCEVQSPGEAAYEALGHIVESDIVRQNEKNVGSLCYAASRGDLDAMKRFLSVTSAECSDYDKRAPLHIAAANGQVAAINLLIARKANINCVDNFGRTPLMEACRSKQQAAAQALFTLGAELGFTSRLTLVGQLHANESMPLTPSSPHPSLGTGDSSTVYNEARQDVEASELCQAASEAEQLWYLRALLQYGANPNAADYDARTALHVACASGNKPAVKLLLKRQDVNFDAEDNFGRTPLMEAVRHGHEACARLLHAKGAHHGFCVDIKGNNNANAVHAGQELCMAAFANQMGYLDSLLSHCGLNVDVADYDKRTALMLACAEGNWDTAISLVQHRADVNRADRWGHTALTEARAHGHPDLAKVLQDVADQMHKTHESTATVAAAM